MKQCIVRKIKQHEKGINSTDKEDEESINYDKEEESVGSISSTNDKEEEEVRDLHNSSACIDVIE